MGWVLAAGRLPLPSTVAMSAPSSPSDDSSVSKVKSSSRKSRRPTVADVRLAIGVDELPRSDKNSPSSLSSSSSSSSSSSISSRLMDFMVTTPVGQPESSAERGLRQIGEWMVERTEAKSGAGLMNLMVLCLSALPVWILLILVAFRIIKLPFMEDLFL